MMQPFPRSAPDDAFAEALRILRDALARVETILAGAEARGEAGQSAQAGLARLGERIDALAAAQEALAVRLDELADRLAALEARGERPPGGPPAPAVSRTVEVVVTGVPGFQGLMDLQRAMAEMEGVRAAPVRGFQGDEATLDLTAETPPSAEALAAVLRAVFARPVDVIDAPPEGPVRLRIAPVEADL
ncbi:MAG TPA: hypothetical protein VNN12_07600 [Dehalococcoidia bacterium]|jgi:hypothetical protein|nr:hypothetical protein [Dehalococcoidia bacterium]